MYIGDRGNAIGTRSALQVYFSITHSAREQPTAKCLTQLHTSSSPFLSRIHTMTLEHITPYQLYPFLAIALLAAGWAAQRAGLFRKRPPLHSGIKIAGAPEGEFDYKKASERFASQAQAVLSEGLKKVRQFVFGVCLWLFANFRNS